jgi:hypothetical protein
MQTTKITFYTGDLENGDINAFDTYEAALQDYKDMAEGCAVIWDGEPLTWEQALQESLNFHYVRKETQTLDEDGEVVDEQSETLDGGLEK